jgi:hypothetical protein
MPLSSNPVTFPAVMPNVPFKVRCIRSAERSGLVRGELYEVIMVVRDATTKRGEGAKGYVVSCADNGEVLPNVWHTNRFEIV